MISKLINPKKFQKPISIKGISLHHLKKYLKLMCVIRKTEQQLALAKKKGTIVGPVHLCAGQEAIAVGISKNLKKNR